jgi:hypothetical protein
MKAPLDIHTDELFHQLCPVGLNEALRSVVRQRQVLHTQRPMPHAFTFKKIFAVEAIFAHDGGKAF